MHVAVLGELLVTDGGNELVVHGPIPRRLVALLANRAGQFLPADTLAEELWAGSPPPAARATLQSHIARLRRAIGAGRIESSQAGYRLAIEESEVDAHRFASLTESGRRALAIGDAAAAQAWLEEALALWRGSAYVEFAGNPALEAEAARLHQLRIEARHWLLEAQVDGPGAPPVAAIEALVREHPTREGLWVLLMRALYRAGRQADALRAYRSARKFLVEELGVEPSRELRDTEQLILRQDTTLDAALDPPAMPDSPSAAAWSQPENSADASTPTLERRIVTVVAVELPPNRSADAEDVAARGTSFRDLVRERVAAYDGTVYAELEGLVVAIFGLRRARADDAGRALRAAMAVVERSTADPRPRAAISTGEAVVTGAEGRTELSGQPLASAERLRSAALPGEVLLDDAAKVLVEEFAALRPGRDVGESAWQVTSITTGPRRRRAGAPFVGRQPDLAVLRAALDKTINEGRPQLVTVEGEPGMGKSRLLQEFESRLASDGAAVTVRTAFCSPNADLPLAPVADIVRSAAEVAETAALDVTTAALRTLLPAPEIATLLPRLVAVVGGEVNAAGSLGESVEVWRRFIEIVAERPSVIVVEDLHWAADLVLDFLESLPVSIAPRPLLLVATTRPDLRERRPSWGAGSATLRIAPLSKDETAALVEHATADAAISDSARADLVARSGGIPLFAEELARLERNRSDWVDDAVPAALSAVIAARIDSLPANDRSLLGTAALLGPEFWSDQLCSVAGITGVDAAAALDRLVQRAFIEPVRPSDRSGHKQYAFTHELVRDAAERRLARADRARHHLSAYQWWLAAVADARDSQASRIAHHACLAYDLAKAAGLDDLASRARADAGPAAAVAGQQLQGIDTDRALRILSRAVELTDPSSADHARALLWYGAALADHREFDQAEGILADALERFEAAADPLRVHATMFLLSCRFAQGHELASTEAAIERARHQLPPSEQAVRNLGVLAMLRLMEQTTESLNTAIAICDEAIALADRHDTGGDALAHVVRGRARLSLGDGGGLEELERALDHAGRTESGTVAVGTRQWHAGAMHHWRGPAAERAARDALEALAEKRGMHFIASMGIAEDVRVAYEMGDLGGSIALAEGIWDEHEAQPRWAAVQRGIALLDLGELDDDTMRQVLATPPADDGDLRHILGVALVVAGIALAEADSVRAAAELEKLGDLQRFVDRDGAVELLPRLARTALAAGCCDLVTNLTGIDRVATPLRRAIAATMSGLLAEAGGEAASAVKQLSDGVDHWHELGFIVEEALTLVDLARNLAQVGSPDAREAARRARRACQALGVRPLLEPR